MGAIRWTGKGLKLAGQILEAEEIEKWLESQGKQFLQEQLRSVSAKWFAGEWRAKRLASTKIRSSVEQGDTFRASLESELQSLPNAILDVAGHLREHGPKRLVVSDYPYDIVTCPRGLVREHYAKQIVGELKDSAELARYQGFPEPFLRRVALESEAAFFQDVENGNVPPLSKDNVILAVDEDFGWNVGGVNGHYYVAEESRYSVDLSKRRERKTIVERTEKLLRSVRVELGKLDKDELHKIVSSLPNA